MGLREKGAPRSQPAALLGAGEDDGGDHPERRMIPSRPPTANADCSVCAGGGHGTRFFVDERPARTTRCPLDAEGGAAVYSGDQSLRLSTPEIGHERGYAHPVGHRTGRSPRRRTTLPPRLRGTAP